MAEQKCLPCLVHDSQLTEEEIDWIVDGLSTEREQRKEYLDDEIMSLDEQKEEKENIERLDRLIEKVLKAKLK